MKIIADSANEEPIRTFLTHELNFAINLTNRIHKMLVEINKIVRNPALATDRMLRIAISVANQQVTR